MNEIKTHEEPSKDVKATNIKKLKLTCQMLWDAGVESIGSDRVSYSIAFNKGGYIIPKDLFTITDLPESGVATKPVDESSWIGKPCWFWDDYGRDKFLSILTIISDNVVCKYQGTYCYKYPNCKLATKEEVLEWFEKNGGVE